MSLKCFQNSIKNELERKRLVSAEKWGPGLSQENADYPILPKLLRMGFRFKSA
jgi:hypothetical protein